MNKKLAAIRATKDVAHEYQLKLHERNNNKQIRRGCGRNKTLDEKIKKTKRSPRNVRRVTKKKSKKLCKVLLIKFLYQRNQFIDKLRKTK